MKLMQLKPQATRVLFSRLTACQDESGRSSLIQAWRQAALSLPGVKGWRLRGHGINTTCPNEGLKVVLCSHLDNPYWQSVVLTRQTDPTFELKEKSQSGVALQVTCLQPAFKASWPHHEPRTRTVGGGEDLGEMDQRLLSCNESLLS